MYSKKKKIIRIIFENLKIIYFHTINSTYFEARKLPIICITAKVIRKFKIFSYKWFVCCMEKIYSQKPACSLHLNYILNNIHYKMKHTYLHTYVTVLYIKSLFLRIYDNRPLV